jgi:hypothetical protein
MDGSDDPVTAPTPLPGAQTAIPKAQDQLFAAGTSAREKYAALGIGRSDLASRFG